LTSLALALALIGAAPADGTAPLVTPAEWIGGSATAASLRGKVVIANVKAQGILWPVRFDDDGRVWDAYGVKYWPSQLVFDRHGRLRKTIIGEGRDAELDATVKALLAER
jgi:hypothetical protein